MGLRLVEMKGLVENGRNGGKEGVANHIIVHLRQIELCALRQANCLLVDLPAANHEYALHLLPQLLLLRENERLVDGAANIHRIGEVQFPRRKGKPRNYCRSSLSLDTMMLMRLLRGLNLSGKDW